MEYSVKNISNSPVRPIGVIVGKSNAADGSNYIMLVPGVPSILTQGQYDYCKDALKSYEDADMVSVKSLGSDDVKKDDVEDVDELREKAKELGVKSWHVMGAEKLREAIAEKEAE